MKWIEKEASIALKQFLSFLNCELICQIILKSDFIFTLVRWSHLNLDIGQTASEKDCPRGIPLFFTGLKGQVCGLLKLLVTHTRFLFLAFKPRQEIQVYLA